MPPISRRDLLRLGVGAAAAAAAAAAIPSGAQPRGSSRLVRHVRPRRFAITHRAIVTNGNLPLRSLEIWLPVPKNQTEQDVGEVTVRPKAPLVADVTGQALVATRYATTGLPGPNGTWSLEVSYEITCRQVLTDHKALRAAQLPAYARNREYELFTRPEKYVETKLPAIVEQARKIQARHKHPASLARAAYDWVLEKMTYKLIDGVGGAGYCLKNGHGECGDYSALLVALLRAAGVPARTVAGFFADRTDGWHVWAEFLLPTGEWIPVDASLGDENPIHRQFYFGSLDNRRVAVAKTMDVELADKRPGQTRADFLQAGCFWWTAHRMPKDSRPPSVRLTVEGRPVKG